ncbi:conserved hypothetical protein [Hyella patelloides LEGE 07179]|uniref:Uncharacterized protein n=1 Tax=Hyella patelloides LEGE 07179 TaxID=945734 RepID=A0A563VYG4_9CYAN|nr:hypothetical protein [Hyella patelloides]VEP16456.1 conserved hypothetical protein [Hyella patelloides LEGE 07179]
MLGKLINFGKKNKFYLEVGENASLADKVEAVATKVKEETKEVKQAVTESQAVQEIKSETKQIAEEAKSKVATVAAKSEKTKPAPEKTPAPAVIDTSYSEEPFWVKLMYKTSQQKEAEQSAEKTFATDYLISKPKSRRRPGGSLDKFKTMARQSRVKF